MTNWAAVAWILTHGTKDQKDAVMDGIKEGLEQAEKTSSKIAEYLRFNGFVDDCEVSCVRSG